MQVERWDNFDVFSYEREYKALHGSADLEVDKRNIAYNLHSHNFNFYQDRSSRS